MQDLPTNVDLGPVTFTFHLEDNRYRYAWKNNPVRARLYGRECRVVVRSGRGQGNSALLQFTDTGELVVSSRNALRRIRDYATASWRGRNHEDSNGIRAAKQDADPPTAQWGLG